MFRIEIDTENDAFAANDGDATIEVARILRELADDVERHGGPGSGKHRIRDLNGNTVGTYHWEDGECE